MVFRAVLVDLSVLLIHLALMPTTTAAELPYLASFWPDLSLYIGPAPTGNVHGGQNFTYCCARALNQFIGNNQKNSSDISVASTFSIKEQFPCGATYTGDSKGASTVKITYDWCYNYCPGWEVSQASKLTQWLQPLIGFILPSIVFALNVPRRRKLQLPDWVFPRDIADPLRFLGAIVCASVAALIMAIDTIIWLLVVFALAGPLLLSGLYEAWQDKRVVDCVHEKIDNEHLPLPLRARILLAILVGNLDQDTAWEPAMSVAVSLEHFASPPGDNKASEEELRRLQDVQARLRSMLACQYSFGSTIGAPIVFYIGSFIYAIIETKYQLGNNDTSHALAFGMWWMSIPHIAIVSGCLLAGNNPNTLEAMAPRSDAAPREPRNNWVNAHTNFLRGRVDRMFGSTYDAKYKPAWMWDRGRSKRSWLLRVCQEYQHEDTKHLEALTERLDMGPGDWAIVSTLAFLLFFIPCTFGFLTSYYTPQIGLSCRSLTFLVYGCSQTWLLLLWIWNLTWRDKDWRRRAQEKKDLAKSKETSVRPDDGPVQDVIGLQVAEKAKEGIVKRLVSIVKIRERRVDNRSPSPPDEDNRRIPEDALDHPQQDATAQQVHRLSWLSCLAKARWFTPRAEPLTLRRKYTERFGFVLFWVMMSLGFLGAMVSAFAGTMMQIMGVYRTCLCQINAHSWFHGKDKAVLEISSNSALDIRQAAHFWIPMGGAAAGFLGVVAYIAWWYQRRLRMLFGKLVDEIGVKLPENIHPGMNPGDGDDITNGQHRVPVRRANTA